MTFVLNKNKEALNPCSNAKARWLLDNGYAVIHKYQPFTIRLKNKIKEPGLKEYVLKIDAGSKTTGLSISCGENVVFVAELHHRADEISQKLKQRRDHRRFRRSKLRYRPSRFDNRKREEGWLAPSVQSIVDNIESWVIKLKKLCPIAKIVIENAKFDTQKMVNKDIEGIEYQQGELQGYRVKEYLLYNYSHTCQYCKGVTNDPILEVEHKNPKSRGGSNKISNLTIACKTCNQDKNNLTLEEWLVDLEENANKRKKIISTRITNIKRILGTEENISLKDAARVNSYRKKIVAVLSKHTDNLETSTGAITKFNRSQLNLTKEHYIDALCTGENVPNKFIFPAGLKVLSIKATGRGSYQRTLLDKYGFPRAYRSREKYTHNFKTGDLVKAIVTKGKKKGIYFARVSTRKSGYFRLDCFDGKKIDGVSYKYLELIQRGDGYSYSFEKLAI